MATTRSLSWAHLLCIWTVVGVALVVMAYVAGIREVEHYNFQDHEVTVIAQLYRAWLWALLTPALFQLRREIRRRHSSWVAVTGLHLVAALALCMWCNIVRIWALNLTMGWFDLEMFTVDHVVDMLGPFTLVDFYLYLLTVGAGAIYDIDREKRTAEQHEEQLRAQLAQAELAALRQQLHPHFLFNALNAVSSLMREGQSDKAVEAIALLSQLLRDLLSHIGQQELELRREFAYVECYLSVEKVRLEDRLIVHFDADEDCLDALVPSLILQPLVENAIKHGVAKRVNPGRVSVSAARRGDLLRLRVSNDLAEGALRGVEGANHGIGLRSTHLRLERIFGQQYRIECSFDGPEGAVVAIEFPLRTASHHNLKLLACKA